MKKLLPERLLIENIQKRLNATGNDDLLKGIGDDCAVYRKRDSLLELVTTDTLVESVHFNSDWHPPFYLGRKAGAVNLSDIAAMGGRPQFALLSMGLPKNTDNDWLEEFVTGFSEILTDFDVSLIGGDTVRSNELVFSVTLIGEVEEEQILFRSGAQVDDLVWVSGPLGEAAAGLFLFQNAVDVSAGHSWESLQQAHLNPLPEVSLARILAKSGMVHAMQDLSDGLATDLAHLGKASGVGALVLQDSLPVSEVLQQAAQHMERDAVQWALTGGEDYKLLFTSAPETKHDLPAMVKKETGRDIHLVGRVVRHSGVQMSSQDGETEDISFKGYEHF